MANINESAFWMDEDNSLWDELASLFVSIYLLGIDGGIDLLPENIRVLSDFGRIQHAAAEFAKNYRFEWIRDITETTRKQTQEVFANWVQSGSPLSVLEGLLTPIYGEARAERIAVTETTRIFAQANMDAWESTGLVDKSIWQTAQDDLVCPICGELDGTEIGVGDLDAAPPAHINCRCYLKPVVSEEGLEQALERILAE